MKHLVVLSAFILLNAAHAKDLDATIALVKGVYGLQAKSCELANDTASEKQINAGKTLFESESLSGNRDISCSSCHLDEFGSADGLPISVGVGGEGEGHDRIHDGRGILVQRNAFSLFGRASEDFTAFFWDGKVQLDGDKIVTQFGAEMSDVFASPLAVAAAMPLIERDEFIGKRQPMTSNEVEVAVENKLYQKRYKAIGTALRHRLLNSNVAEDLELASALRDAGVPIDGFELAHAGNLLAAFIAVKFPCNFSAWDEYLAGNADALSDSQKRGAIVFFGKGRCASCHVGSVFSDFEYHSIGTPQGSFGPHSRHRDIGRAAVTHRSEDLYLFRTPPLTDVSTTAPYGHNGAFGTLEEIVVHHFNPLQFYVSRPDYASVDYFRVGKLIDSRDSLLSTIDIDSNNDLEDLIDFLSTL